MRLGSAVDPMEDTSEGSSSSTILTLHRRRKNNNNNKHNNVNFIKAFTTTNKSVSFHLDRSSCITTTRNLPSSSSQHDHNDDSSLRWYTHHDIQQFKMEVARQQGRIHKDGTLPPETNEQTSLGLDVHGYWTRCKREYCYDAVIGEQIRAGNSHCSPQEKAERIAKAYVKVQTSFATKK